MDKSGIRSGTAGKLLAAAGKYKYALLVLLLGVFLMLLPTLRRSAAADAAPDTAERFDRAAVQEEMESILSAVDGAGKLRLMLTVESAGEQELARDGSISYKGTGASPEDYTRKSETVVLGSGANAQVVVTKEVYPRYVGALIVCEGGDSAAVRLQLTQAVSALTGLSSDRITVVKGKP